MWLHFARNNLSALCSNAAKLRFAYRCVFTTILCLLMWSNALKLTSAISTLKIATCAGKTSGQLCDKDGDRVLLCVYNNVCLLRWHNASKWPPQYLHKTCSWHQLLLLCIWAGKTSVQWCGKDGDHVTLCVYNNVSSMCSTYAHNMSLVVPH